MMALFAVGFSCSSVSMAYGMSMQPSLLNTLLLTGYSMEPYTTMALYCGQIKRIHPITDTRIKSAARELSPW